MGDPVVDFWLITYKKLDRMPHLLEQIRACGIPHRIHVWDNSCDEGALVQLRSLLHPEDMLYTSGENLYCCRASQELLRRTSAPYIAYLCSVHTEINKPSWIQDALDILNTDPKMAMVGHLREMAGLYYYQSIAMGQPPDKKPIPEHLPLLEEHFSRMAIHEEANHHIHVQGGVWVARRVALEGIGGFETSIKHIFMDVELAVRLQCYGWTLGQVPGVWSEQWAGSVTPNHKEYPLCHYYREASQ
jgi:GT2 family glycosyltransferase